MEEMASLGTLLWAISLFHVFIVLFCFVGVLLSIPTQWPPLPVPCVCVCTSLLSTEEKTFFSLKEELFYCCGCSVFVFLKYRCVWTGQKYHVHIPSVRRWGLWFDACLLERVFSRSGNIPLSPVGEKYQFFRPQMPRNLHAWKMSRKPQFQFLTVFFFLSF